MASYVQTDPAYVPTVLYYTAKNINATPGSRTAINADLKVGHCLVLDPFGPDKGRGVDATQPQTSYLEGHVYIVTKVPSDLNDIPDSTASTQRRGGYVSAVRLADCQAVQAFTKANMTGGTTRLGVANGQFELAALTLAGSSYSQTEQTDEFRYKAKAMETSDTSSTVGIKWVEPVA